MRRYAPIGLIVLQAAVFWSVWRWYVSRLDGSAEGWLAMLPLAAAAAYYWRAGRGVGGRVQPGAVEIILLLVYAASYAFVPPLVRALLAATCLSAAVSRLCLGKTLDLPAWGLAVLSLPVMPTIQFFAGYPLRLASTAGAAAMLNLSGVAVVREGACLRWGGALVAVDAPCSGVRMLWAAMALVCVLGCVYRLGALRWATAAAATVGAVVAGNALRAASLFYLETHLARGGQAVHAGVGVVVFALTAAAVVVCARHLGARHSCGLASTS